MQEDIDEQHFFNIWELKVLVSCNPRISSTLGTKKKLLALLDGFYKDTAQVEVAEWTSVVLEH